MNKVLQVNLVSDGIVVDFANGTKCYYPATFLLDHTHRDGNQVLLSYDPSFVDTLLDKNFPASSLN